MQSALELLYRDAMEHFNDTLRFLDSDELEHYQECTEVLSRQEEKLAALFRRGLALGLRLASLTIL